MLDHAAPDEKTPQKTIDQWGAMFFVAFISFVFAPFLLENVAGAYICWGLAAVVVLWSFRREMFGTSTDDSKKSE